MYTDGYTYIYSGSETLHPDLNLFLEIFILNYEFHQKRVGLYRFFGETSPVLRVNRHPTKKGISHQRKITNGLFYWVFQFYSSHAFLIFVHRVDLFYSPF